MRRIRRLEGRISEALTRARHGKIDECAQLQRKSVLRVVNEVHRAWSPNGADRFYDLVKLGFFDDTRFFRAVDAFMVQFGLSGDPTVSKKWQTANVQDDPVTQSNKRGFITFAQTNAPKRTRLQSADCPFVDSIFIRTPLKI